MRFRKNAHAIYKTEYQSIWISRYRRKVFVKGVKEYTKKILFHVPELDPDIEVVKVNVQENHIQMIVVIRPKYAVARVRRPIFPEKASGQRVLRTEHRLE